MSDWRVAVVGATGAVGRTMIKMLEDRSFPLADLRLISSSRSAGSKVETRWGEVVVEDLASADPAGIDLALFSAGGDRSREFAPGFVAAGAVVIDNSSAFRQMTEVPLVVAGVNDHAIADHHGIIANPNCTTMTLMMAAAPLHRRAGLASVVVTSYQSVSGSGQRGMDELARQNDLLSSDREALAAGGWSDPGGDMFPRPIGWNVVPHAGNLVDSGYTDEEWKLVNETRKILESPRVLVEPTCVRVPVMVGHAVVASMTFDVPVGIEEAIQLLKESPGIEVWTDRAPTPLDSAGKDVVLVGRIRESLGHSGGINLWAVGD
ncbi:MAG TPA: aspartate-semialdehyde dehydrogenase, partial [Acidimicrobiia bacterium]|nr:aspartate-semialdehyde dehydrogenase [Acidimicrobiia bacterium]